MFIAILFMLQSGDNPDVTDDQHINKKWYFIITEWSVMKW